ncbi:MAG TPA: hypothetical protein VF049_13040 [Nocardioidaceae bacterium]
MTTNPLVRVAHPGIEGTAVVPEKALRHMSPDWQRVDDQANATETTVDKPSAAKKSPRKRATTPKEK